MKAAVIPHTTPPGPLPARKGLFFAAWSLALLLPCFWQSRIQAGDLSSHIYNAWLAQLIAAGKAPGLAIIPQATNTLFDLLLSWLFGWLGPPTAQRLAVAAAVLIFAWGAFAYVTSVSSRAPRAWMPVFAILAYGWVFHSGFFNFYLSLGLCLFAGALAWEAKPRRCVLAGAILAIAWTAHNLPVLWMVSIVGYAWIARRLPPRRCALLFGGCVAAVAAVHAAVRASVFSIWFPSQIRLATGADQAWLFDDKYLLTAFGLGLLFWIVFIDWAIAAGIRRVAAAIPAQVWALTAAGVALIPTAITGKGWQSAFISDRMSLPAAICLIAMMGTVRLRAWQRYGFVAVALIFFGFLFRDGRILNAFEDRLQAAVAAIPPGQRVVSAIDDPDLHVNALAHMIDRVCVGRCFSYANYEASTGQFRIRVTGPSPIVAPTYVDSWGLQNGTYPVAPSDLPLYQVTLNSDNELVVRSLAAGETGGTRYWKALPDLF